MNIDIKSASSIEIKSNLLVTNMSCELFQDAKYFREEAQKENDFLLKKRYLRAAIMCFCSSAEAWISTILRINIRNKNLTDSRHLRILRFIEVPNSDMPERFTVLRVRLYHYLPEVITGNIINWNVNKIDAFENYIELSDMRNQIVHYTTRSYNDIYGQRLIDLVNDAPQRIFKLFEEYDKIGNSVEIPSWYSK